MALASKVLRLMVLVEWECKRGCICLRKEELVGKRNGKQTETKKKLTGMGT